MAAKSRYRRSSGIAGDDAALQLVLKMSGTRLSYRLGGGRQTGAADPAAPADEYAFHQFADAVSPVDYLSTKRYDAHLRRLRRQLAERKQQAWQALLRHLPPEVVVHHSDSGYFLWIELPEGADASALSARALASHISIARGKCSPPPTAGPRFSVLIPPGAGGNAKSRGEAPGELIREQLA